MAGHVGREPVEERVRDRHLVAGEDEQAGVVHHVGVAELPGIVGIEVEGGDGDQLLVEPEGEEDGRAGTAKMPEPGGEPRWVQEQRGAWDRSVQCGPVRREARERLGADLDAGRAVMAALAWLVARLGWVFGLFGGHGFTHPRRGRPI